MRPKILDWLGIGLIFAAALPAGLLAGLIHLLIVLIIIALIYYVLVWILGAIGAPASSEVKEKIPQLIAETKEADKTKS